jgi:hypothetical protein
MGHFEKGIGILSARGASMIALVESGQVHSAQVQYLWDLSKKVKHDTAGVFDSSCMAFFRLFRQCLRVRDWHLCAASRALFTDKG